MTKWQHKVDWIEKIVFMNKLFMLFVIFKIILSKIKMIRLYNFYECYILIYPKNDCIEKKR